MLDIVVVHFVPNWLQCTLEFSWFNTPWVNMAPTPVCKRRYEDAGPGTINVAPKWKVLVSKLTGGTFSRNYFPILVCFKLFRWGGTGWQRSLSIQLSLWESIIWIYVELMTYLGKRRPFNAASEGVHACMMRDDERGWTWAWLTMCVDAYLQACLWVGLAWWGSVREGGCAGMTHCVCVCVCVWWVTTVVLVVVMICVSGWVERGMACAYHSRSRSHSHCAYVWVVWLQPLHSETLMLSDSCCAVWCDVGRCERESGWWWAMQERVVVVVVGEWCVCLQPQLVISIAIQIRILLGYKTYLK